jgi:amino acid permease
VFANFIPVLALSSASFADSPAAIVPATCWIVAMGAMFAYEFELIGKVCSITLSNTFREAWQDTIGDKGALAVSLVNMLKPALGNLAYSMILADTFRSLFGSIGLDFSRNVSLVLITVVGILPLCLLKKMDALAPFSVLGTAGVFLTAICMGIRYFDGSYDPLRNGRFVDDIPEDMVPLFGSYNGAWTGGVLVFVAMIYEAFVAH